MAAFAEVGIVLFVLFILLSTSGGDVIQPGSIICIMALLSLVVLAFLSGKYDYNQSGLTILFFGIAIFFACVGSLLIPHRNYRPSEEYVPKVQPTSLVIISLLFVVISTALYYREVRSVASMIGYNTNSQYGFLYYYRTATEQGNDALNTQSKLVGQMVICSYAVSYYSAIDFIKRAYYGLFYKKRIIVLEICTMAIFMIQCILSGGRTQFLYFIEAIIFLTIYFYYIKYHRSVNTKMIRKIFLVIFLTFIAFYFLGSFTGKTKKLNIQETLFSYIASPIPAFDKLINKDVRFPNEYFGSDVFIGLYDILHRLGFKINVSTMPAPFTSFHGVGTNIYGAFGRYYGDFGVIGLILIPLFLGIAYQMGYLSLYNTKRNLDLKLSIFLICSHWLFDFCIEDRFFLSIFALGTLSRILYMILLYWIYSLNIRIVFRKKYY